jgi:pimeloyl-ACP methyl ester carboxylesterase
MIANVVAAPPDVAFDRDSGRARVPDETGFATADDGIRIAYEVHGSGDPTLVLLPSSPIIHSRQWKAQVPYLSRTSRVITYDGRGNGRSDRPHTPDAYADDRFVGDIEAVMNATGTDAAVLIGLCVDGVWRSIRLAARTPERVRGIVAFSSGVPRLAPPQPHYQEATARWEEELPTSEGWAKMNRRYWQRDYADFAHFFFSQMLPEPHSTKALEDATGWAVDGDVDAMFADHEASFPFDLEDVEAICRRVSCPLLIVHGTDDRCQLPARAHRLAELTGGRLLMVEGAGHMIPARHPVLANLLIRDFIRSLEGGSVR